MTAGTLDIVNWAESEFGFYVDRHFDEDQNKFVLEPGPIQLAPHHRDILRHTFTPDEDGRLPYDTVCICESAKSGKSAIAALVAEYFALHVDTNTVVIMASSTQNQAGSIMFRSLTDSIDLNPFLPNVDAKRYDVQFANGNSVRAIPSNAKGAAGQRFSVVCFDELWSYVYTDATRLFSEFKPDPTRTHCVRLALGYGGYVSESSLWQNLLDTGLKGTPVEVLGHITNQDGSPSCWQNGRHFVFWSDTPRQPWQDADWLQTMRSTLSANEYARMVNCQFAEGLGNFLDQADWELLIDPKHKPLPPGSDKQVYVGVDLATAVGGDDAAVIGVYSEDGKVKVAWHKVWKAANRKRKLTLTKTVLPYLLNQSKKYRIASVHVDPYQALQLAEELRKSGIRTVEVQQTHGSRGPKDTALLELAVSGRLVLYKHEDLRTMASGANVKELPNGMVFLRKAGREKIDLLVALSNCADEAGRGANYVEWLQSEVDRTDEDTDLVVVPVRSMSVPSLRRDDLWT